MPAYSEDDSGSDFGVAKPKAKKVAVKASVGTSRATTTIPAVAVAAAAKKAAVKRAPVKKKKPVIESDMENLVDDDDDDDDMTDEAPATKAKPAARKRASTGYDERLAIEEIYQKKTQIEHILLRPDTYIGSVESMQQSMWVYENDAFVYREIKYVPGMYKIVDEILVNAADNKIRDSTMDTIKVDMDVEKGTISVYNNGKGIPIQVHKEEGVYVPELIFGHLLTSSNYNDNEKKVTGGRNGYGAKLCNIFSREFIVETADRKKKYKQVFRDNMSVKKDPEVKPNPREEEYTRITFTPDFAKFGMTGIDADLEALIRKRVYDLAGVVKNVKVFLNGDRLKVRGFKQYIEMLVAAKQPEGDEAGGSKPQVLFETVSDRWEVGFAASDGQFQQVSFVNSICTSKGGTHVAHVADNIANKLLEAVKKKDKSTTLRLHQIRNHLWIFVNCLIENPAFDSQTKETMTLKASSFGSKCELSEEFIKKVLKGGVLESILSFAKFKQDQQLKKTDGSKRSRLTGIVKLEDANNAGTRNARNCTLILTEGDSAKSLAVSGLSVVGRDNFGVFPLRGKLLNVRDATHAQIMANAEISQIKQILGLQHGKQYENTDSLRYGHLMIMTDQDHDGSHIKGLLINFLDHFFSSLLRIPGFLLEFITPIVKVTRAKRSIAFYTMPEYERWKEENDNGRGWTIKYYKGLGTSTKEDAVKYFTALDKHMKRFNTINTEERELIDMAFSKKRADDRKEWLRQYVPGTHIDHDVDAIAIKDFVQKELILFSIADNVRSIPSVVDGFKPGQRKVLFGCFKRNLKGEIKVAQLGGYVAEHSAYHHGEQSLTSTIVGLAQDFVGSNNVNVLEPRGQFGTRLQGGKDAASARYIFTALNPITRSIFPSSDDRLLNYLNDDGDSIEPEWYMPILPMVLVNGSDGIGTGWSSSVPNYDPIDIIANLRRLMSGEALQPMLPWYRGFKGTIEKIAEDRYKITGTYKIIDDTTIEITELPIRTWTQSYKEQLEVWVTGGEKGQAWIKDYKEYHTDSRVHFVVSLTAESMRKAIEEGIEKRFKLSAVMTTSNMVCFDSQGRITKYANAEAILEEFYHLRLDYYNRRKELLLKQYTREWTRADNRVRFIKEIIKGDLVLHNKKLKDLVAELRRRGYAPIRRQDGDDNDDAVPSGNADAGDVVAAAAVETDRDYDYLLDMPQRSSTWEKVQTLEKEKAEKEELLRVLTKKSPKDLWNEDLDVFLQHWGETLDAYVSAIESRPAGKGAKGRKHVRDDSDDDYSAAKPKPKRPSLPKKAPAKQVTLTQLIAPKPKPTKEAYVELSDEDKSMEERIKEMAQAKTAVAPPVAKKMIIKKAPSKPVPATKKSPAKGRTSAKNMDSDDSDAVAPVAKKAPAKGKTIKAKFMDLDDSDTASAPPPRKTVSRATRKPARYIELSDDEEEEEVVDDASDDFEMSD